MARKEELIPIKQLPPKDFWITPDYILERVTKFYGKTSNGGLDWFDPCPSNPEFNGADPYYNWYPRNYINPPFSNYLPWVRKGLDELWKNKKMEQIWMMHHDSSALRMKLLLENGSAMCMFKNRVKFIDNETGKPSKGSDIAKSQSLIYIGDNVTEFLKVFKILGYVVELNNAF